MRTRRLCSFMATVLLLIMNLFVSAGNHLHAESGYEAMIPSFPALSQEENFLCGDVNEDGFVNVLDIISMVNHIMGGNPSPFNQDAADINADSGINVLDVIAIVNIIMQVPGLPCGCVAPVTYEGQTYTTVQIGAQCWFKENLNIGTMIISSEGGQLQSDNQVIEKYCYENMAANCNTYGGLYEWNEAMQYEAAEGAQGICPPGWHVPKDGEWSILEGTVDSFFPVGDPVWNLIGWRGYDAGGNLKETGTAHWSPPNKGATNSSGFTGLPGGGRGADFGDFGYLGYFGTFWSSSQEDTDDAWRRGLYFDGTSIYREGIEKEYGFSIRCLKGCWPQPTQADAGPDQLNVPGTSAIMAANIPGYGSGVWAIISGTGGTFVDPWSPTAEFQGVAGNEYILSWTITTNCDSSADTVVISFAAGFSCGDILLDIRDGQSYPTVLIGTQCWIAANLNIGTMIESNSGGFLQTGNGVIEKYCYNNDADYCTTYGGLYEWPEAMQYDTTEAAQGICPAEWHIPTDNEWKILEGTVDTQYPIGDPEWDGTGSRGFDAGGNLKEEGTVHWAPPNLGATNSSGFTALPSGYRFRGNGGFTYMPYGPYFWSSSHKTSTSVWYRSLFFLHTMVDRGGLAKDEGYAVRCIKD